MSSRKKDKSEKKVVGVIELVSVRIGGLLLLFVIVDCLPVNCDSEIKRKTLQNLETCEILSLMPLH